MQVRKQQLEVDMEQQTGSKLGKEYVKAASCHPAYLTYMQSTSWETLGWKKHKLELEKVNILSIPIAIILHASKVLQNSPSQASTVHELWTSTYSSWF